MDPSEGYVIAVMGVPDASKGEALVLLTTLELAPNRRREKLLENGLPNLWVPRTVRKVAAIPVRGTGKLDLKGCKELALQAVAE
ncbi:MAG: hypothetical protein J6386_21900 [Candidatus Synoicihabitans palmerolidicus]|nr:hypothetical protein [Candidatus Synoicihabitans palmerolidicus]